MKREDLDWSQLRGALITLSLSAITCGLLVWGSYYFLGKMRLEFNRNNALFQNISSRYLAVDEEEKLIRRFYPRFLELQERGVIGREQRLAWIETLRDADEKIMLPSMTYEIKSQGVYLPPFSTSMGRFQVFASGMSLNMQLLHEGDLLKMFEVLDREASGTYTVSSCRLNKAASVIDPGNITRGNIIARCELNWFTINLADGSEIGS